jgi:hypothetical protein
MQSVSLKIRDDVTQNIWLIFNDLKKTYYLRDLSELGMTLKCPLETSEIVICEKSEPIRCTLEDVQELTKVSGYVYAMITMNAKGQIEDYVTTV